MQNRKPLLWVLRLGALLLIVLFFVPMFTVSCTVNGQKMTDPVSIVQVSTGTGDAMHQVAEQQNTRTKAYPVGFIFLLLPLAAAVISFFKKLQPAHLIAFAFAFFVNGITLMILALVFFQRFEANHIAVTANGWFHVYFWVALILSLVCMGFILKDLYEKYKSYP